MKLKKRRNQSNIKPKTKAIIHDHDYSNAFDDDHMEKFKAQQRQLKDRENLKNRFKYAKRLIKSKRYNDARYELVGIKHPKADEWLEKLNELDPKYSERFVITPMSLALVIIFILLIGALIKVIIG